MNLKECVENAESLGSTIDPSVLALRGMSGKKVRHLLHNLGKIHNTYLEIGTHTGSTLISVIYQNNITGIAVDNWSQFSDADGPKLELLKRLDRFNLKPIIYEVDFHNLNIEENLIDLYMYDGNHSKENQFDAIKCIYPFLKDEFTLVVDDYNDRDTKIGTKQAIEDCSLTILEEYQLLSPFHPDYDGWWNGIYLARLKK